jgi:hypothetical protein
VRLRVTDQQRGEVATLPRFGCGDRGGEPVSASSRNASRSGRFAGLTRQSSAPNVGQPCCWFGVVIADRYGTYSAGRPDDESGGDDRRWLPGTGSLPHLEGWASIHAVP